MINNNKPPDTSSHYKTSQPKSVRKNMPTVENKVDQTGRENIRFTPPLEKSPSNKRISPERIEEQSKLFQSSRALKEVTMQTPLCPSNMGSDNVNDVYITQDIVFKPGVSAAQRSTICYGLARLIGVNDVLVSAKKGEASVIARQDLGTGYGQLQTSDGKPVLVNLNRSSDEEHTDAPKGPFPKIEGWLKEYKTFQVLEDNEDNHYVVPKGFTYPAEQGNKVVIDNVEYKASTIDKEDPTLVKLTPVAPNASSTFEGKSFRVLYQSNPASEELDAVLVPNDSCLTIVHSEEEIESEFSFNCMGENYKATQDEDGMGFSITADEEDDDLEDLKGFEPNQLHISSREIDEDDEDDLDQVVYDNDECFFVKSWRIDEITKDAKGLETVERNGQPYQLEKQTNGSFHVVGHNIKGMVQSKVENVFVKPSGKRAGLDIRTDNADRTTFFSRIDKSAFTKAFIATILLRPQDGKIVQLDQSNVLFQVKPDENGLVPPLDGQEPLFPVLIDLDETLPQKNDADKDNGKHVHPIRCGLMGFPQAREPLSKELQKEAVELISEIVNNKKTIQEYLQRFVSKTPSRDFTKEHIAATIDVIERLNNFIDHPPKDDWSLQDLLFSVFPGYEAQWNHLIDSNSPAILASRIGFEELPTPSL